jgi:hypothetical protein
MSPSPSVALVPGSHLGVYEVTAVLGAGGMGEVYRAYDATLRREVAFKMLPAAWAADLDQLARLGRHGETPSRTVP